MCISMPLGLRKRIEVKAKKDFCTMSSVVLRGVDFFLSETNDKKEEDTRKGDCNV